MRDCVFCAIARGEEEAFIIYKDDLLIAFLDKFPVSVGHVLIAPIKHFTNIFDMPEDIIGEAFILAKRVAEAQSRGLGAQGVKIVMNNNREAGQEIMHAHIHVIPYGVPRRGRLQLSRDEGEEVARILREALV
ncbi:MAG: HIT family protein [Infirmifilum sp.]|uniref:HIT family protein n=1 Tax=Infirmifilum TaxID=2856573 RepID=UPI003C743496